MGGQEGGKLPLEKGQRAVCVACLSLLAEWTGVSAGHRGPRQERRESFFSAALMRPPPRGRLASAYGPLPPHLLDVEAA